MFDKRINFVEGEPYTRSNLAQSFSQGEFDFLLKKGILSGASKGNLKFTFVGVISGATNAYVVEPKILDASFAGIDRLGLTINTLKKYSNENTMRIYGADFFELEPESPGCSELSIASFLLADYKIHGLYRFSSKIKQLNGYGSVDWPATVLKLEPLLSATGPIYQDTINDESWYDEDGIIREIHKWSIFYLDRKYSMFLGETSIPLNFRFHEAPEDIAPLNVLFAKLNERLAVTFVDREQRLLKSLIFLIRMNHGLLDDDLSLFGTKSYQNVWEHICRKLLQHQNIENDPFEPPNWFILDKSYFSGKDLRPDITAHDDALNRFFLFDAKYYRIQFDDALSGEPGYKDILKQFQYQQQIEIDLKSEISNAFLFPISHRQFQVLSKHPKLNTLGDIWLSVGYVSLQLYPEKKIWVILCSFEQWAENYVQDKLLDLSNMLWAP